KEVPPFIALLAKISMSVFGDSVFASRIFTTIASGIIIWLTGLITKELGGRKFAITLACLSMILAPAFAASGYLFQPVVFDQLWWVLTVWLLIKYINTTDVAYLYGVGATVGIGMLTKYTMVFFTVALIIGILISKQRKLLFNKHMLGAALLAFIMFLPNLIWQWQHHFPVINHMSELRSTQLDHISAADFIMQQLLVNGISLFVWLAGFLFLMFSFKLRKFQFLAIGYILIFIFLLQMNGKSYYLFGAYPMLFAAGGYAFDRILKTSGNILRGAVVVLFTLPNLLMLPIVLPVLPVKQTLAFFNFNSKKLPFLNFTTKWEDQKQHATTQDYGDMFGWDEMAAIAAKVYNDLTPEQKSQTTIIADNYGQAGAIHLLGKRYNLPEVICFNSSFSLWAPDSLTAHYIIYVAEEFDDIKHLLPMVETYQSIGEVQNPLARERGTGVYLLINPKPALNQLYKKDLEEIRAK
ncbi:MAG: glycosyltransferase family 39 protein, partial [Mucilaginibacter sp.]